MARAALAALLWLWATASAADEQAFTYVSALPEVRGERIERTTGRDPRTGHALEKEVFELAGDGLRIRTHRALVRCAPGAPAEPYIVAVQLLPTPPQSFEGATSYDRFAEVYVTDETGRVRLYRDVTGMDMGRLTERFLPSCPDV